MCQRPISCKGVDLGRSLQWRAMTDWQLAALALALMPFATVGLVSLGVGLVTVYACWVGRNDARDAAQERACAGRRANALRRAWWLLIEGVLQTIAFALQGLHLVRRRFPPPPPPADGATPVILLAGYLENSGLMYPLGARLRRAGFLVIHRDLPSTLTPIETNAAWLGDEARRILAATGADRVAIVAHSMGGVIARTLVHQDPSAPVSVVASIASPHRGTHMGRLGIGGSARDMTVASEHCRRFPTPRAGRCHPAPVHSIVGFQEDIVSPYWSSILEGEGDAIVLDAPAGHVAPLFMPSVAAQVVRWLEAADVRRVGAVATARTAAA
jgi:pimeloyl-ACP methyl ester carboxylesterase